MSSLKSRWKRKGTGEIIHPETEIDQLKNGDNALAGLISLLLKSATTADARSAISAAAASHTHSSGDIQSFASDVITAIGEETLEALGVRYSITTNGYICFGQLFGGLILQWTGKWNIAHGTSVLDFYWPISFPVRLAIPSVICGGWKSEQTLYYACQTHTDHLHLVTHKAFGGGGVGWTDDANCILALAIGY